MMEQLFTDEELVTIETAAQLQFEEYYDALVISGDRSATTLLTISKINRLIFVEGNDYTGFRHLTDRHGFFSFEHYYKTADANNFKLDNPSKFHPRMMPIIDYVKIADMVFNDENKNVTNNSRPDLFDKYTGMYAFENNIAEKYHLLTYKNTKVIHTLFPDKKKNNQKSKSKYGKGIVTSSTKLPEGYRDMALPYQNPTGITIYSVLFRRYFTERVERLFIVKHSRDGEPKDYYLLGYRELEHWESFEMAEMHHLQFGDTTDFENFINEIELREKQMKDT